MTDRPGTRRVLWLLSVLTLVMTSCGREGRLPTAITKPSRDLAAAAPKLGASTEATPERAHRGDSRHRPRRVLITEARTALGAVLSGEQVYYQKFVTFTDAADTTDLRVKLGVYLTEPSRRWTFSVSGASVTGFIATAQGRDETEAERIVVTLRYIQGQPIVWTVHHERPLYSLAIQ